MLIYPKEKTVRLYFGRSFADYLGMSLSIIGFFIVSLNIRVIRKKISSTIGRRFVKINNCLCSIVTERLFYRKIQIVFKKIGEFVWSNRLKLKTLFFSVSFIALLIFTLSIRFNNQIFIYEKALRHFNDGKFDIAQRHFLKIINKFPYSPQADDSNYYYAICIFKENRYKKTIQSFQVLIDEYPESTWVAEAYYHIGLCYEKLKDMEKAKETYKLLIQYYPSTVWAKYAREKLIRYESITN